MIGKTMFGKAVRDGARTRNGFRPEVGALEGRALLTAYTFDPARGEIRVQIDETARWNSGPAHTFFMGSTPAGRRDYMGDDNVVLLDYAGPRRLAVNVATGRPQEVRVDQVRSVVVVGSDLNDRISLDFVSPKYGFSNVRGFVDGRGGDDSINGTAFDDLLLGGTGNDVLRGFAGNDTLRGGDGNDTLIGHEGRDAMFGENGDDTLFFALDADDSGDGGSGFNKAVDWRNRNHSFIRIQKFI